MRLVLLLVALALAAGARADERILSFHSDIEIGERGVLTVTETIEVRVEGNQIKRGILRDFPTDYEDRFGRHVTVPFRLAGVKRDGQPEPASAAPYANGVRVRIGNANVLLPRGVHRYEITYATEFQLGFFEVHDELYWNVTGNGWTFPIDRASAEVRLPRAVAAGDIRLEAYTGPFGARGKDYSAQALEGGARFQTTRPMPVGAGLTIVVGIPKGVVLPPTWREKVDRWRKDNPGEVHGAAWSAVLAGYLLVAWFLFGRDPSGGPLFPRYEAPKGMGPAAVRYVDRMKFDNRCFASALLGLGQRGYLRIQQFGMKSNRRFVLQATGSEVEFFPGEAPVRTLVQGGSRSIGREHDPLVQHVREQVEAEIVQRYGTGYFQGNGFLILIGVVIAGLGVWDMVRHLAATASIAAGVLGMIALLVAFGWIMPSYTQRGRRLKDEIDGLRQYLSVAEKDDLAREKRPPRTKEEFARFLPYAVALGVEKTWADAFAKVLGAAAVAAAVSDYYQSGSGSDNSPSNLGSMTSGLSDMGGVISAASTPPGSSSGFSDSGGSSGGGSSDSGGSSGGGGGGGGGSGW